MVAHQSYGLLLYHATTPLNCTEYWFTTGASDNGDQTNGIDDRYPYVGMVELHPALTLGWKERIGLERFDLTLWEGNVGIEGKDHLLVVRTMRHPQSPRGSVRWINAVDGSIESAFNYPEGIHYAVTIDVDQDNTDEIFILGASGFVRAYNADFQELYSRFFPGASILRRASDLDGNGVEELQVVDNKGRGFILNADLKTVAILNENVFGRVRTNGVNTTSLYTMAQKDDQRVRKIYESRRNPFWIFYRLENTTSWSIGLLSIIGFALLRYRSYQGVKYARQNQELQAYIHLLHKEKEQVEHRLADQVRLTKALFIRSVDHEVLRSMLDILDQSYADESFSVEKWALAADVSTKHLQRLTKEVTGQTPKALIRQRRMNAAIRYLQKESNLNIAQVAYAVGYKNPAHFSKAFKGLIGVTPSSYQARYIAP